MILLSVYFSKETPFVRVNLLPLRTTSHAHIRAHIRVYARAFQQRCCFFAVTSVTRGVNLGGKTVYFLDNGEEKQNLFRCLLLYIFCTWITNLLKFIQTDTISSWNTMGYYIPCDTCDSKNAKTLDRSVRVRARERVFIGIFTIPMFPFLFLFQSKGFLGFSPFIENNTSVSIKQHVVFNKTTRRFQQNNTSFSAKQHDVFDKTNRGLWGSGTRFPTIPSSDNAQQAEENRKNSKKQNTLDLTSWNCQNQG